MLRLERRQHIQNCPHYDRWRLHGIHFHNEFRGIVGQDRVCLVFVDFPSPPDDILFPIIRAIAFHGTLQNALKELFFVFADQVNNLENIDIAEEQFGLADAARQAVEYQNVLAGLVQAQNRVCIDMLMPDLDCHIIRDQFTAAGILVEKFADLRFNIEVAEDLAG